VRGVRTKMLNESILQLVEQFGYLAFFLAFSLGPFGIPVPNEITMITAGLIADTELLHPGIIYLCIISGLLTAITVGFFFGAIFGRRVQLLLKNKKSHRHFQKAERFFNKNGDIAICLAIFVPVVRYLVPVIVGMSGVKFKKFAILSFSSSLVWTALFFGFGQLFGERLLEFVSAQNIGWTVLIMILVVVFTKLAKHHQIEKKKRASF
jgi:membrane-associated protein